VAEGPNVGKVSVKVQPDTSRFHRTLKRQLERGNDNYRIPIDADLDTKSLKAKLEKFTEEFGDKVKIPVEWETPKTAPKMPPGKKTTVPVDPDTDLFRQRLLADVRRATRNVEANVPLTVDGERFRRDFDAAIAATERRIREFTPSSDVGVTLFHRKQLQDDINQVQELERRFLALGGPVKSVGGPGGFGMMGGNLALVAAVATLIPPAFALIAGTATLIPAALAGIAAPIGAVVIGLEGIGKAAEDAGLTAKDEKGKTTLGKNLQELKTVVSDTFTNGLTPAFTDLNNIIPKLQVQMQALASGMSNAFSGITDSLSSDRGLGNLQSIIADVGAAFDNARPGMRAFTDGLLELAAQVAQRFPGMGEAFSNLGNQFVTWVDKFTTADPVTGVSKLDTTLQSLKSTWDEISGLGGDLFKQGLDWASDPNFGENMTQFFADVRLFITETLPALETNFTTIADGLNQISAVAAPVGTVLNGLAKSVQMLFNPGEAIAGSGGFVDMINSLIPQLQGIPTAVGAVFSQLGTKVAGAVAEMASSAASGMQSLVSTVAGVLASLPGVVAGIFGQLASSAAAGISAFVSTVVSGGAQAAAEVASWPGRLVGALAGLAGQMAAAGAAAIGGFISGLTSRIGEAIGAVRNMASSVIGAAKSVLSINSPSKEFISIGGSVNEGFADGITSSAEQPVAAMRQVIDQVTGTAINIPMDVSIDEHVAQLRQQMAAIDIERKNLQVQMNQTGDKALKQQMDALRMQKQQLDLEAKQLSYADKYSEQLGTAATNYGSIVEQAGNVPMDFAMAASDQFMGDLGISGNGALTSLAKQGLQWGSQFVFNVSDVDSALGAKDRITNQQSLQMAGR